MDKEIRMINYFFIFERKNKIKIKGRECLQIISERGNFFFHKFSYSKNFRNKKVYLFKKGQSFNFVVNNTKILSYEKNKFYL